MARWSMAPEERLLSGVEKTPSGCWLRANVHISENGYTKIRIGNKKWAAHRWAYVHFIGPIPNGCYVSHRCDNRHCVNPEHLVAITSSESSFRAARKGPIPKPPMDRFWKFVAKRASGCWEWIGGRTQFGYGCITLGSVPSGTRRQVNTHRLSYEFHKGPIPDGLVIDHLCRNPPCVNPDHLEAVDQRTNFLRGTGMSARNAAKTHCKNGHEFTVENIKIRYQRGLPSRVCLTCRRERDRRYYERKKLSKKRA